MARDTDKTDMGGSGEAFQTTHWSEVYAAGVSDAAKRNAIMGALLGRYWKPVYSYLRRRGHDNEQAKDLTQGFFQEIVLDSSLVQRADRKKGRFRSLLLTALNCYVSDVHRKASSNRRSPRGQVFPLETYDSGLHPPSGMHPEQIFNYVWATELLDTAISRTKQECLASGKEAHWNIFNAKILYPIINNSPAPSLCRLCEEYGIDHESKASNMTITVKRCFHRILKEQLRLLVRSDAEVADEYNDLFHFLGQGAG